MYRNTQKTQRVEPSLKAAWGELELWFQVGSGLGNLPVFICMPKALWSTSGSCQQAVSKRSHSTFQAADFLVLFPTTEENSWIRLSDQIFKSHCVWSDSVVLHPSHILDPKELLRGTISGYSPSQICTFSILLTQPKRYWTAEQLTLEGAFGDQLVQPSTQSRDNFKVRSGCSGLCSAQFWKLLRTELPHLSGRAHFSVKLSSCVFFLLYIQQQSFESNLISDTNSAYSKITVQPVSWIRQRSRVCIPSRFYRDAYVKGCYMFKRQLQSWVPAAFKIVSVSFESLCCSEGRNHFHLAHTFRFAVIHKSIAKRRQWLC